MDRDYSFEFKTLQDFVDQLQKNKKYSIEAHGDGYALYYGRDMFHHGANLAFIQECSEETRNLIVEALNDYVKEV